MRYDPDARIARLEQLVEQLTRRLEHLEDVSELEPLPTPPEAIRFTPPAPPRPAAPPGPPPAPPRPAAPPTPARPSFDLEELLGGRVLAWAGAAAVFIGVVFFLATALRRGWIDEPTRVVLAYFGSTALLVLGLYLYERKGRSQAALAAVAAAIASLYASTTAATTLYDLVDPAVGLGVALLVGATATAIAVRWDSRELAGIGIVGALLSPVLVDAGTSDVALAFMAVALVSAAGVLLWKRWDWLAAVAFLTSAPQLVAWLADSYVDSLALALAVLTAFWVLYAVAAIGYELRDRTENLRFSSASLLLGDAILTSGAGWLMLDESGRSDAGTGWVIGVALVHVALGAATLRGRISSRITSSGLPINVSAKIHAAGLAAGQGEHAHVGPLLQRQQREHVVDRARVGEGRAPQSQRLADRQVAREAAALEQDPGATPDNGAVGDRVEPQDADLAVGRRGQPFEHLERRGLPGAIGAEQRGDRSGRHVEIHPTDGLVRRGPLPVGPPQSADPNRGGRRLAGGPGRCRPWGCLSCGHRSHHTDRLVSCQDSPSRLAI